MKAVVESDHNPDIKLSAAAIVLHLAGQQPWAKTWLRGISRSGESPYYRIRFHALGARQWRPDTADVDALNELIRERPAKSDNAWVYQDAEQFVRWASEDYWGEKFMSRIGIGD